QQWDWCRAFTRALGHQGWLFPTLPQEHGGGGLTPDHAVIINEELGRRRVRTTTGGGIVASAYLMVYGTPEQKQEFLRPMLLGETSTWQCWTEPDAGVDLASIKTRAIKDGDDFVFN